MKKCMDGIEISDQSEHPDPSKSTMLAFPRRLWPALAPIRALSVASSRAASAKPSQSSGLSEGELAIHDKLTARFAPSQLQVQDVSGA